MCFYSDYRIFHEQTNGAAVLSWPVSTVFSILIVCFALYLSYFVSYSSTYVVQTWGIPSSFIGGIFVPLVVYASELLETVKAAYNRSIKLLVEKHIQSSLEMIMLVAPLLVIGSWISQRQIGFIYGVPSIFSIIVALINLQSILSIPKVNWLQGSIMVIFFLMASISTFIYGN